MSCPEKSKKKKKSSISHCYEMIKPSGKAHIQEHLWNALTNAKIIFDVNKRKLH